MLRFLERGRCGGVCLIGDFGRAFLPRARLRPVASYEVSGLRELEDSDFKRTTVWASR